MTWETWLYNWQTLITGVVSIVAAFIAFGGALLAARWQVKAVYLAADAQVATMQRQLIDAQEARAESDRRGLSVIEWAVKSEARRLEAAAAIMEKEALPGGPGTSPRAREQLIIESSPLLRGVHEDTALLDDDTRALLEQVGDTLDEYNVRIQTANVGQFGTQIVPEVLHLIRQLHSQATELRREV